jgi:hypothetical protein
MTVTDSFSSILSIDPANGNLNTIVVDTLFVGKQFFCDFCII